MHSLSLSCRRKSDRQRLCENVRRRRLRPLSESSMNSSRMVAMVVGTTRRRRK
jgi:hypothetical protein